MDGAVRDAVLCCIGGIFIGGPSAAESKSDSSPGTQGAGTRWCRPAFGRTIRTTVLPRFSETSVSSWFAKPPQLQ